MMKMHKLGMILMGLLAVMMTACNDDDYPRITFHDVDGTYSIDGSDMVLVAHVDGITISGSGSSVKVTTAGGKIANLTLLKVIPGYDMVAIGGVEVEAIKGGSGISFQGKMALNDSTMIVFAGTIVKGVLTIDVQTVPLA